MKQAKKDYLGMFDVQKGILILLIIWIHHQFFLKGIANQNGAALPGEFRWTAWILGLFFIMAGYQYRPAKNLKIYARKQMRDLLVPYGISLMVSALILLIYYFARPGSVHLWDIRMLILGGLYGTGRNVNVLGVWFGGVVALWFLPVFCFSRILYQLLRSVKSDWLRSILIWGLTVAAVSFPSDRQLIVPFFVVQTCAVLGFIETGRILKERRILYQKFPVWLSAGIWAAAIWCHCFSVSNIASNVWKYWMLDYAAAAAFGVLILRAGVKLDPGRTKWCGAPAYIGMYSMLIYCIHSVDVQVLLFEKLWRLLIRGKEIPFGWQILLSYVLRVALTLAACAALKRLMRWKYRIKMKKEIVR